MSDHIPTLADICSAIADGHIDASVEGDVYQLNARELRRYLRRLHSRSSAAIPIAPDAAPVSETNLWAALARISVA